ncbi:beta/gamma crystallin-related protein [Edwardsiella piscicida]|nr:beta/gamma crystallin-related protein [Edwardsiella piscicida]
MLTPFSSVYADAARSEQIARYKVGQRCERGQGEGSLFCRPKDATCSTTTLDEGYSQGADRLMVYEDSRQRGASLSIDRDIPDLSRYRFADRISSFSVPQGWTVRFYEGTDYSGDTIPAAAGSRRRPGLTTASAPSGS